jgi:RNA polymerase sigma-32 factor
MPMNLMWARKNGGARSRTPAARMNTPEVTQKLAADNIALVHHIARQFRSSTVSHEDMVGDGMVGLVEGARRFDESQGTKAATYLGYWIRARIFGALQKDAGVTTNAERQVFFRLRRAIRELESAGREPSPERIADHLGADLAAVTRLYQRMLRPDVRLDAPTASRGERDNAATVAETAADDAMRVSASAEDDYGAAQAASVSRAAIEAALARMPERDAIIIRLRFLSEHKATLQSVADLYGISRERARQLELRGLKRLRQLLIIGGVTGCPR